MKNLFSRDVALVLGLIAGFLIALSFSDSFWANFQQWLFTGDFLKVFLGTMMGGLIAGSFSLKIAKNQSIFLMDKLKYEKKFEICKSFLNEINPSRCIKYNFNLQNIISLMGDIFLVCDYQYSLYAKEIVSILTNNIYYKYKDSYHSFSPDSEQHKAMRSDICEYTKFFNIMQLVTADLLDNKKLIPFTPWDISDYKGTIAKEYQNRIA